MKSSVEKLNDTRVKMTVEVPFEELTNEIDQAYKTIAASVNIPGFRKGKAPRKLIDARFGRGPVLEQVVNDALPSRYEAAIAENQLVPLGQPKLDLTKIEDGDVIEFTAEVDVRPDITLPDFNEVSVQVPALGDEEEAVNKELDRLRERFAELTDVDEPVAEDNFVTIDIKAVDAEGNPGRRPRRPTPCPIRWVPKTSWTASMMPSSAKTRVTKSPSRKTTTPSPSPSTP